MYSPSTLAANSSGLDPASPDGLDIELGLMVKGSGQDWRPEQRQIGREPCGSLRRHPPPHRVGGLSRSKLSTPRRPPCADRASRGWEDQGPRACGSRFRTEPRKIPAGGGLFKRILTDLYSRDRTRIFRNATGP